MQNNTLKRCSIYYILCKYAHTEALLLAISNRSKEIQDYILNLDQKLQGFAVGAIKKQPSLSVNDLDSKVQEFNFKLKLKEDTIFSIEKDLIGVDPTIKSWAVIQIKKYPAHKNNILLNIDKISEYVNQNDIIINNYSYEDILKEMASIKLENNMPNELKDFFQKTMMFEKSEIDSKIDDNNLKKWFNHNLNKLRLTWIENVLQNKELDSLLPSFKELQNRNLNGEFRGREIPSHPLYDTKYNQLFEKIQDINDWYLAENPDINKMSPFTAIQNSQKWHLESAKQESKYSKLQSNDIYFGPSGWKDKSNNGYFFVELKEKNDLKQEGHLMNHCVGSYADTVSSGISRIFSLRNTNNPYNPIITVETDPSVSVIRQDYGPGNSKIDKKYHDMVQEAFFKEITGEDLNKMPAKDRFNLAENPNTPPELLVNLSKDNVVFVRVGVAGNPNAPPEALVYLSKDSNRAIIEEVARNPNTPPEALVYLSEDRDEFVIVDVAANPNAPPELLVYLSKFDSNVVRAGVARNPNAPPEVLVNLSKDMDEFVREYVARNPNYQAIKKMLTR